MKNKDTASLTAQKSIISVLSTDVSGDEFLTDQTRKEGSVFYARSREKNGDQE